MIRTTVHKIYKLSKESATFAEALKRIINECIHGLLSDVFKATSVRALKYSTSMDGSLREALNEVLSKSIATAHATLTDIFMEIEGRTIGVERELLYIAQKTDLLQIFKQTTEKRDTLIKVMDLERLEKLVGRIIKAFECKNFHELLSIGDDFSHFVSDILSVFNPEKETVECKVIMEEELD